VIQNFSIRGNLDLEANGSEKSDLDPRKKHLLAKISTDEGRVTNLRSSLKNASDSILSN
jgi:hypothetical protein